MSSWLLPSAAGCVSLAVLLFAAWLWRRMRQKRNIPGRRALVVIVLGMVAAFVAMLIETWALGAAGVSIEAQEQARVGSQLGATLSMMLFCVPLEEALKVALIWPLYLQRRLTSGALGVSYAVFVASGFAAGEVFAYSFFEQASWLSLLRVSLAIPAHIFFAGVWGYVLGGERRDRFFALVWFACVLVHGIYDHIVFGRGLALLVVVVPMLATMAWGVYALLRSDAAAPSTGRSNAYSLFDPPSVGSVRQALEHKGEPLKLHWILIGAFVNLGVMLTFLAAAVYAGHRLNVDFSLVEQSGREGILPISFLGTALLASFPVAAFLIARASGTRSVLEPAWAMAASIIFVLALFSVTEPTALVIAIGIAPVGFLLACLGALFGLERRH